MKYLKIWTSFYDLIGQLQYDEIGRLFEAMLVYAESGKEPEDFDGNERFLWPVAKQQIDLAAEKNEILRQNGMKGGRPKADETKRNQTKPKETKGNQSKAIKERKGIERKEKERNDSFLDDDNARAITDEQNRILDAAEDAGFTRSNSVRAKLIDLYAVHGLDKVLAGIESCVRHGAVNLAYLEACMKDQPKKKPVALVPGSVAAYDQRDYSGETEAAIERMMAGRLGNGTA